MKSILSLLPARRYGGRLVFEDHDEQGLIEVIDKKNKRYLHLGSDALQSCLDLKDPDSLALQSTQAMMHGLLYRDRVEKALVLGLGGGSVVRFLNRHYPSCKIDIVETRQKVIDVAQSHFFLPRNERIRTFNTSALSFSKQNLEQGYDLILVDLFDQQGMCESLAASGLFKNLKRSLGPEGIVSLNLWRRPIQVFNRIVVSFARVFDNQILANPIEKIANCVIFGFNQPQAHYSQSQLSPRAIELEKATRIEFNNYLQRQFLVQGCFFDKLPKPIPKPYFQPIQP